MSDLHARRLVLITGASSGIGLASARRFARRGDRVIGVARTAERLEPIALELGQALVPIPADVCDPVAMDALTDRVLAEHGVPDVVVANAGVGLDARLEETTDEALRTVFEINVFGLVRTIRPFLAGMVQRNSGRILLVSSIVGKRGIPHYAAYSASKFALHGLADALRVELFDSGVTVGLVCPSSTSTEFQDNLMRKGPRQSLRRPRRHSAESVANAIVKMAENERREVILSAEAKLLTFANAVAPGLVDRLLARMARSRGSSADPVVK